MSGLTADKCSSSLIPTAQSVLVSPQESSQSLPGPANCFPTLQNMCIVRVRWTCTYQQATFRPPNDPPPPPPPPPFLASVPKLSGASRSTCSVGCAHIVDRTLHLRPYKYLTEYHARISHTRARYHLLDKTNNPLTVKVDTVILMTLLQ